MIKKIKEIVKNRIVNLIRVEVQKQTENIIEIIPQLIEFQNSPKESRLSYYDHTKNPLANMILYQGLKDKLMLLGIPIEEDDIDIADFEGWLKQFSEIKRHYETMGNVSIEKCLEHYLTFKYLKISNNDIYIDIASSESPWAEILNSKGIRSYCLDLSYPPGIKGINIGADVGNTKLPDGFATVLSLHCSFECFMGESDILFIKEANRILNEKGRFGIIPLYIDTAYFVATSPYCNQKDIKIEPEAKKVWRDDEYREPFSRHYSSEGFKTRIYSKINPMKGKVIYFRNLKEVMRRYPGQRIYCFFMFYCCK